MEAADRWLTIADGEGDRSIRLAAGEWVIGRAADCDIVVGSPTCSRRHAKLIIDVRGVRIEDLGSKGGTHVNGVSVVAQSLRDGDRLLFGTLRGRFHEGSTPAHSSEDFVATVEAKLKQADQQRIAILFSGDVPAPLRRMLAEIVTPEASAIDRGPAVSGAAALPVLEAIAQTLDLDDEARLKTAAELTLLTLRIPLEALLVARRHDRPAVRALALSAIARECDQAKLTAATNALAADVPDPHPAVRREQARTAGRNPRAVPLLARLLRDTSEDVRLTAARAPMAAVPEARRAFLAALDDASDAVAAAAADWLLERAAREALPEIVTAMRRRRHLCAIGARRVGDVARAAGRDACPVLEEALADPDPDLRRFAARTLLNIEHRRACSLLATAAADTDATVRDCAAVGLSRLGEEWSTAALQLLARGDADPGVRSTASMRLQRAAVSAPAPAGDADRRPPDRVPAVGWTTDSLRAGLEDAQAFVRERAADLLGDRDDREGAPRLRPRLADSALPVRAAAARALAHIGDRGAATELLQTLADAVWRNAPRQFAMPLLRDVAEALGVLGDVTALEPLLAAEEAHGGTQVQGTDVFGSAIDGLVSRLGRQAVAPLERALHGGGRRAHQAARLLGRIDAPEVAVLLLTALDGPDPHTTEGVIEALGRTGGTAVYVLLLSRAQASTPEDGVEVRALDGALSRLVERHGGQLPEEDLRRTADLWLVPAEPAGDVIREGRGFPQARVAAFGELHRRAEPVRRAWIRRISEAAGRGPDGLDGRTRLGELADSWSKWMFLLSEIDRDLAPRLVREDELKTINTVGELAELFRRCSIAADGPPAPRA